MSKRWICVAILLLMPLSAPAKPLIADLSRYHIDIDSSFTGTNLLLFGSRNDTGDIVVVVRGPDRPFIVRKKERIAGLWVNRREAHFENVPSYYFVAASRPFENMRHTELFAPLAIGLEQAVKARAKGNAPIYIDALIHHQEAKRLYDQLPQKISFMGESLFKLRVPFPDTIPDGNYSADIYLFNDGQLTGMQSIPLHVEKIGFDAFIYDFSSEHAALYGLAAILFALGIGWGASTLMQRG